MNGSDELGRAPPESSVRTSPLLSLYENLRPAFVGVISLTLLTGCAFPLVLLALGNALFPSQAAGSLVTNQGVVVGSRFIGQTFTRPDYFQPRPSAAGAGYDATASGGTNLAPSNPKLIEAVRQSAQDYRKLNHLASGAAVPIDAVTSSGSGLDPHISPENAALQVPRVAKVRGLSEDIVRRMLIEHTEGRQLGFLGAPRVSVLDLNLALDRMARRHDP
jgi:K+-transporting ATPase ATPase C chain